MQRDEHSSQRTLTMFDPTERKQSSGLTGEMNGELGFTCIISDDVAIESHLSGNYRRIHVRRHFLRNYEETRHHSFGLHDIVCRVRC